MLQEGISSEPVGRLYTSYIWYDRAAEVEGKAPVVGDDLRRVGVLHGLEALEGLAEGADLCVRVIEEVHQRLHLRGLDEGLVALHVDDDIGRGAGFLHGLLYAVGAALMVCSGHDGTSSEGLDTLEDPVIIGSHVDLIEHALHLFVNSLDDSLSAENCQRLARKAR